MRQIATRLSKLAALSTAERADLARAQLALVRAQLAVWSRPVGRLVRRAPAAAPVSDERAHLVASRLARAVRLASSHGFFRPTCLVRVLALLGMLEQDGIGGCRMRVGVRDRQGVFEAHAWIEFNGQVLGDSIEHVRSFAQLADLRLMQAR